MKRLTWIFELFDRMSGPARKASGALDDLDRKARRAAGDTEKLSRKTKDLGVQSKKTGDGIGWMGTKLHGWMQVIRSAWNVVSGLTTGLFRLGSGFVKAGLDAASFKESTTMGLEVLLGSRPGAESLLRQGVKFAAVTPFSTQDTMRWIQDLTGAGFGGAGLWQALSAAGDVAALRGGDPQVTDRIITVFRQIKGKGRLQAEELMQLAEVGLPIGKVWETLSKRTGISAMDLQSQKNAGRISADLGIWAIEETIRQNISGGTLGNLMKRQSGTFSGLTSTLMSRPFELMMDLDQSEGFKTMKKALENLVAVLDPESPSGKRIKANVERLFDGILGGIFKQFEDPAKVEAFINTILEGIEKLIPKVGELAKSIGDMAANLRKVGDYWGVIAHPVDTVKKIAGGPGGEPVELGYKGLILKRVLELRKLKAEGKLDPSKSTLPPLFGREGGTQGMLDYWEKKAAEQGMSIPSAPPPASGASSKPTSFNFHRDSIRIQVDGAGDPKAVAEETADALARMLDRLGAQAGVA